MAPQETNPHQNTPQRTNPRQNVPGYQPYEGTPSLILNDCFWGMQGMEPPLAQSPADLSFLVPEDEGEATAAAPAIGFSGLETMLPADPRLATSPKVELNLSQINVNGEDKKNKARTAFTQVQLHTMNKKFDKQHYMSPPHITEMARDLNLTYKQVKTWFQNKRMKFKRNLKDPSWVEKNSRAAQQGSQRVNYSKMNHHYSQGYPVNHSANLQGGVYLNQIYTGVQTVHGVQNQMPKQDDDGAMGLQGEGETQNLGLPPQQPMDMYHQYPAVDYSYARPGDGFNAPHTVHYPPGSQYHQQLIHQQPIHHDQQQQIHQQPIHHGHQQQMQQQVLQQVLQQQIYQQQMQHQQQIYQQQIYQQQIYQQQIYQQQMQQQIDHDQQEEKQNAKPKTNQEQ